MASILYPARRESLQGSPKIMFQFRREGGRASSDYTLAMIKKYIFTRAYSVWDASPEVLCTDREAMCSIQSSYQNSSQKPSIINQPYDSTVVNPSARKQLILR